MNSVFSATGTLTFAPLPAKTEIPVQLFGYLTNLTVQEPKSPIPILALDSNQTGGLTHTEKQVDLTRFFLPT